MTRFIYIGNLLILGIILSVKSFAQINDEACSATELPLTSICQSITGTTVGASASAGIPAPTCTFLRPSNDVWFRFTISQPADVLLTSQAGTIDDGVMQVFAATDCRTGFSEIGCNDDPSSGGRMPVVQLRSLKPGTYYIRFFSLSRSGTFSLCGQVFSPLTATFDVCDSLVVGLANTLITYTGSASPNATYNWIFDGGAATPGYGPGPHRVNWSTPGNKRVSLSVEENGIQSELFSRILTVVNTAPLPTARWTTANRTICQGQTVPLPLKLTGRGPWAVTYTEGSTTRTQNFGDASSCNPSTYTLTVTPNQTTVYRITSVRDAVGTNTSQTASLTLTVSAAAPPTASITLSSGSVTVGQALTATYTGSASTTASYAWSFDGGLGIPGTGGGPQQISWSSAGVKAVRLTVSQNGCESAPAQATLVVAGNSGVANDEPCGALDIPVSASCTFAQLSTAGATPTGTPAGPACFGVLKDEKDVWFRFSLAQISNVVVGTQAGTLTDAQLVLYRGSACNQLTASPLACDDNTLGLMPVLNLEALPSGTYWVRLAGKNGSEGTVSVCIRATPVAPPTAAFTAAKVSTCAGDSTSYTLMLTGSGPWRLYYTRTIGNVTTADSVLVGTGLGVTPFYYNVRQRFAQSVTLRLTGVRDNVFGRQPASSTLEVELLPVPTATFSVDRSSATPDQEVLLTYTGTASAVAAFDWGFDGAVLIRGEGRGPYTLKWLTPGTKTIRLQITQNGCVSPLTALNAVSITGTVTKLDAPCDAQEVPVGTTLCPTNYPTFSLSGATLSAGLTLPACLTAGQQRDIWLKFTLPTSQSVVVTTQAAGSADAAMQVLSATSCSGSFSQLGCDDDSGPGSMPELTLRGLSAGTYYIRLWNPGGGSGSVGVCVTTSNASPPLLNARFQTTQSSICQSTTVAIPLALTGTSPWRITYDVQPDTGPVTSQTVTIMSRTGQANSLTVSPAPFDSLSLRSGW